MLALSILNIVFIVTLLVIVITQTRISKSSINRIDYVESEIDEIGEIVIKLQSDLEKAIEKLPRTRAKSKNKE